MRKFELYLDNNRLALAMFRTIDSKYESRIFRGEDFYKVIRKLGTSKLVNISIVNGETDLILEYKNYVVNINQYSEVFRRRGLLPLIGNIKEYEETKELKKKKIKKVKRTNKHTGKKVIAASLALVILYSVASNLLVKDKTAASNGSNIVISTDFDLEDESLGFDTDVGFSKEEGVEDVVFISSEEKELSVILDYPDWSDTNKANLTRAYYSDIISKYARMYGIDPKLAIAIATQESDTGIHTTKMDPGGATGLMQIQNDVWVGNTVSAYNFETGQIEALKVTNNNISDLEYNIKIGCMILQNAMEYMNHNILAGIQCYNMGCGNVNDILDAYSRYTGKSRETILSDPMDIGWMEFRKIKTVGEPQYVEKVLSWMGENNTIKNIKRDGTLVCLNVDNQKEDKKIY